MDKLTFQNLDAQSKAYNELVIANDELDSFCSSTHWILPAHRAFAAYRPLWIRSSDAGYVALARSYHPTYGLYLEPLEAAWGLACPFVPRDPWALASDFAQTLQTDRRNRAALVLSGLLKDGAMFQALQVSLSARMRVIIGETARRYRASLAGGLDGFLSRRTPGFRANLRRSERLGKEAGIEFEHHVSFSSADQINALYERILQVERMSWKGQRGTGVAEPAMQEFYRLMLERIWEAQLVRAIIARQGDQDVGFVFGAVFHHVYRGLQVSFDHRFSQISLGNLLQARMIGMLADENCSTYDLGVEVPYKERWAEQVLETVQLVAV